VNRRERREQRQQEVAVIDRPASMVAAAANVRFSAGIQNNLRLGGTDWQQEGWLHYDTCPEFRSGVNQIATKLSRADLIGVDVDPVTGRPNTSATDDPDVVDIMRQFFGGPTGQSQALDRLARHLTLAGDSWCLATDRPDMDDAVWEILATTDVTGGTGQRIMITEMTGIPRQLDPDRELLIRIWRPHPKRRAEADSMTRPLLTVLRELASLSAMVSATVKSRLASAGILWLPENISLPQPIDGPNDDTQTRSDSMGAAGWLDLLTEAMTAPIRDPDSASAVVPLVAIVKGDLIEKIKHMEFGRDLDATIEPLRQACVRRLAVGMDMPPEVLTGLSSSNHWTAWTITEEFAKTYLAPLLELIADAITVFYLRPALRARGRDPLAFAVGYDMTPLYPQQISVDNATAAHKAGLLKDVRYLEVLGFSEDDMSDPQERARHLIEEMVARGNPQTLAELAGTIRVLYPGIDVRPMLALPPGQGGGGGAGVVDATPTQRTEPAPAPATNAPPARPASTPPPAGGTP
jgi:hypothetical protein